jgi:mannose-6-phosphate isomerase-like protein (cupin superfamily)/catechol 2,3-dioxygenase-like lactoylglutathione lyase family enzyme
LSFFNTTDSHVEPEVSMSTTLTSPLGGSAAPAERHIASDPETSRAWWFLGTLAVLRNPEGAPRTPAVIELTVPPGGSPPRHVHHALEDSFLLLEGEMVVRCADETIVARPGTYVVVPVGVEHTFRVTSRGPARMLLVHGDDSFLQLIEAAGTPTRELRLPPEGEFDVDLDTLVRLNEEHDSHIVGGSLDEDEARSFVTGEGEATPGPVNHISVTVTDVRRSAQWYQRSFGLLRVGEEISDDGIGHVLLLSPTGGWILSLNTAEVAGVEHIAVTCRDRDDLVAWRERLVDRAADPGTITDADYGSGFVVRDPDGLELELFTPAAR